MISADSTVDEADSTLWTADGYSAEATEGGTFVWNMDYDINSP